MRTRLRAAVLAFLFIAIVFASMGVTAEAARNENACQGKNKKECEVPEVPWTLVLPVASVGLAAGYYLVQRLRYRDESPFEA